MTTWPYCCTFTENTWFPSAKQTATFKLSNLKEKLLVRLYSSSCNLSIRELNSHQILIFTISSILYVLFDNAPLQILKKSIPQLIFEIAYLVLSCNFTCTYLIHNWFSTTNFLISSNSKFVKFKLQVQKGDRILWALRNFKEISSLKVISSICMINWFSTVNHVFYK